MTKLLSVRRQARLTTILALGVALTAASIAHAKSNHHHDHQNASNSVGPHFAISGQPADVKKVMRDRTKDTERLGGFEIDDQFKLGQLQDWQFSRIFALENSAGINA